MDETVVETPLVEEVSTDQRCEILIGNSILFDKGDIITKDDPRLAEEGSSIEGIVNSGQGRLI